MLRTGRLPGDVWLLPLVLAAAGLLWLLHAQAWDLGGRSPILNYDTAQYALAGRELAWNGRLATPYALPIELVHRADPPWPLAAVQPGLVLVEAAVFRLVPARGGMATSDARGALTLLFPLACYLMITGVLAIGVRQLLSRWAPNATATERRGAMAIVSLAFALDPEAQHFATGGFTELPFTLGLLLALLALALGRAAAVPLAFGLVLGVSGLFRANMLWLAPLFVAGAAWSAPPGRRVRVVVLGVIGFALPLSWWWIYKWRAFGSPAWDLTRFVVWDQVGGRTWFSLYHRPEVPQVPHGFEALRLLAAKAAHNLPSLVQAMLIGPRGLWIGATVGWLALARPARPLAAAAIVALLAAALGIVTSAVSIPWLRYLLPTRVLLECVGMLALGALLARVPALAAGSRARTLAFAALAVLALSWGARRTLQGNAEARTTSAERGVPESSTLTALSIALNEQLTPGETVMSNLGPALAWQTNHAVVHLALTPQDVPACRRRQDFRHIVLAFRDARRAWPGWSELVEQQGLAATMPELGVTHERRYRSRDGFVIVWFELGPLAPAMAARADAR